MCNKGEKEKMEKRGKRLGLKNKIENLSIFLQFSPFSISPYLTHL
jgi:hypothetical protein